MADFFQDSSVATLHRLGAVDLKRLEDKLTACSAARPIALVLPCHAEELDTPALRRMIEEISQVPYLAEVIVGIDGADALAWRYAKKIFGTLPQCPVLLWNDGPLLSELLYRLEEVRLQLEPGGKGRNLWMSFGYVLASGRARMLAVHDCDIHTYSREMLARLCYPVANLGFSFCKGYSARFTDRFNGRVMRLLCTPLIRALQSLLGAQDFLTFFDAFRYPLSGEVSFDRDLLQDMCLTSDWGVEAGMLAEVFRICSPERVCQIDVAECYDHKHRELSPQDPHKGLNKMASDIAKRIFQTLAAQGVKWDQKLFDALEIAYIRQAQETMRLYAADADVNGLKYHYDDEELAVMTFMGSIQIAARDCLHDSLSPDPSPGLIPGWGQINAVAPDFLSSLYDAVTADNSKC